MYPTSYVLGGRLLSLLIALPLSPSPSPHRLPPPPAAPCPHIYSPAERPHHHPSGGRNVRKKRTESRYILYISVPVRPVRPYTRPDPTWTPRPETRTLEKQPNPGHLTHSLDNGLFLEKGGRKKSKIWECGPGGKKNRKTGWGGGGRREGRGGRRMRMGGRGGCVRVRNGGGCGRSI